MTEDELRGIIDGIAPVIREQLATAKQRVDGLEREIRTVRDALLERNARILTLEQHLADLRVEMDALIQVRE